MSQIPSWVTQLVISDILTSQPFFNMICDRLLIQAEHTARVFEDGLHPGQTRAFADDLAVLVRLWLQALVILVICEAWAKEAGMVWADKKGKQAMFVSPGQGSHAPKLRLKGNVIAQPAEHAYLGTMLCAEGAVPTKLDKRIAAGHRRLDDLRRESILVRGMSPHQARKILQQVCG